MKNIYSLILVFLSINFYAQSDFIKGYFVDNLGIKTECLINNTDWDLFPSGIRYKLGENSKLQESDINTIKEFGGEGEFTFKRFQVAIDEFKTGSVSTDKSLNYSTKILFLKQIVSGKANLYSYNDSGSMKFFFSTNGLETPVQLEFKLYSVNNDIFQNNSYKQQLLNKLKADNLNQNDFDKLEYKSASIIKLFEKYNGQEAQKDKKLFKKLFDFNLYLKAGYQKNSFNVDSNNDFIGKFKFDDVSQVKFGVELEFVFPSSGKNNYAGFIEVSNLSFNGELMKSYGKVVMEYSSLEIPVGFKYYIGISDSSKFSLSAALNYSVVIKSEFKMDNFQDVFNNYNNAVSFNFGLGYKFKNKIYVTLNTLTNRNLLNNGWNSDFKNTYVMLGYNFL